MARTWLDKLEALDARAMRALDRRIAALYADALKDAIAECKRLMAAVEKLEKELTARQKADADTAGIERALSARRMALMREKNIVDKLAAAFREAGEKVSEEIRRGMAEIYGLNKNATLDMVRRAAGQGYSFSTEDEEQAYRVVLGVENAFDKVAYASLGNAETLKAAFRAEMAKAALLGEGQDKVVQRLKKQCDMATYRARRIAQTERTRVQSRARLDAMEDAESAGVRTCKEWWSSSDGKTRDTHQALRGQTVMTDEKFRSPSGALLSCPGDASAPPGEVINCRCVLVPRVLLSDEVLLDGKICRKDDLQIDGQRVTMVIPVDKVYRYALSPVSEIGSNKLRVFQAALGYRPEDAERFFADLWTSLRQNPHMTYRNTDQYGDRYQWLGDMTGPNGNTTAVRVGWVDKPDGNRWLATLYVNDDKKKKGKNA